MVASSAMILFSCFLNMCICFAYTSSYGVRLSNSQVLCSDIGKENNLIQNILMVLMSSLMSIGSLVICFFPLPCVF